MINLDYFAVQMGNNAERVKTLVHGVSDEQARWKPDPESWSVLEVVNHLYDEERSDFRVRLDYILHRPGEVWPGIDPAGWVIERQYNQRDLAESLNNFFKERQESLVWIKGLVTPNWAAAYEAPFGTVTAGDMFAAWVAHDLLHMRQLVELHWAYTTKLLKPYQTEYAGSW